MKVLYSVIAITLVVLLTSCESNTTNNNNNTTQTVNSVFDYSGVVEEVIQTSKYTYCYLKDDNNEHWVAITKTEIFPGETLYFNKGMEMIDFKSKELDRTFPSVFFVEMASTDPTGGFDHSFLPEGDEPVKPTIEKKDYAIQKALDGITIADLFENKDK